LGRRLSLNFSTLKSGVAASGTVTYTKKIPFPFKIAYLKLHAFVGQAYNLQVYIFVGPRGSDQDTNLLANVENAANFFAGDDTPLEVMNMVEIPHKDFYITVKYVNTDAANAMTGFCFMVVEEL
jgi:hypothetical protein